MPEGEGAYRLQHQARSPPQHLHAARVDPSKCQAGAPALAALPKGTLVEQGRRPPGPCSRDLVSAKLFPVRLAKGSHGGRGPSASTIAQGTLVERGRHPPGPCSRGPVSAKWVPARLAAGSHGGSGRGTSTPLPKGSCWCIQSLYRLSPCSLLSLLFLLHGCAVRPGHSGMNMHGHAEDL